MPRIKSFNEEAALEKAMNLFWKKGFHATSMQDIVEELAINRASLYATYGGKKDLFIKAFDLYRSRTRKMLQGSLLAKPNIKEGFRNLFFTEIDSAVQDCDSKGCFAVNTTTELAQVDDEITMVLQENRKVFVDTVVEYLEYGKKAGQIPQGRNSKALANHFFMLFNGLKVMTKLHVPKEELKQMVEEGLDVL